ncbi:hypothetical protein SAMN05421640_0481 [Ekhidna lutea]|uniref:Uncharacterized protein n=1 Tax=Ekhidna lutea TaxID=447679 RepID=A0A239F6C6_EKHLU|nr:hypothetical protein [Ekhidna lutea]SNS51644.1 hypothetical protein SAMN05421640_0481 [Ekhidna lutea]
MKYTFVILVLIAFQGQSQSYTVIHTIGKIYDTQSGSYLSKGTKISEDANLKFETDDARAAVLSSERGRFVIQQNSSSTSQSDAVYALTSVISPVRGRLSTRAGSINNTLDFQKHFNEGPIALLGDSYFVSVSSSAFPMSESKFFYVQYQYANETINKKLDNDGENLVFDLKEFFSIDGNSINPEMVKDAKLLYYNTEEQASTFITKMDLAYVSDEQLKSLNEQFPDDANALLEIINSIYGKCTEEQLKKAISNF